MTLRTRILFLFVGFALLPLALLGAGDYVQSVSALRMVVDARAEVLAGQTARDIEAAYARAEEDLRAVAGRVETHEGALSDEELSALVLRRTTVFDEVRILSGGRVEAAVSVAPVESAGPASCAAALGLRVRVPVRDAGGDRQVEGFIQGERLPAIVTSLGAHLGPSGYTQVIDAGSGRILFDPRCEMIGQPAEASVLRAAAPVGTDGERSISTTESGDRRSWLVSLAHAGEPDLTVAVYTDESEFLVPFRKSRLSYLGVVLSILVLSAVAFLWAARRQFGGLRALTAAADQIEVGNLRPWLPPPGQDEVGRLSLAFRNMIERLSESIRQVEVSQKLASVGELASYLSHEIRNPLSSIRLSLQSLHRDLRGGFIPSDADRVIEIAMSEVRRLDGVVRTVLQLGRPAESVNGRTCSVHETLEETIDVLAPRIRAQGLELEYSPRAERDLVVGDAEGLRGVWINLLVNAVDALDGMKDGRIRISTWTGQDEEELHVRIADNGPGVPPDIVDSIFQPFFTTKMQGNGIGLPTALNAVEQCQGRLTYEPVAAGTGAVFVVRLKLVDPENPDEKAPEEPQREPALPLTEQ